MPDISSEEIGAAQRGGCSEHVIDRTDVVVATATLPGIDAGLRGDVASRRSVREGIDQCTRDMWLFRAYAGESASRQSHRNASVGTDFLPMTIV